MQTVGLTRAQRGGSTYTHQHLNTLTQKQTNRHTDTYLDKFIADIVELAIERLAVVVAVFFALLRALFWSVVLVLEERGGERWGGGEIHKKRL